MKQKFSGETSYPLFRTAYEFLRCEIRPELRRKSGTSFGLATRTKEAAQSAGSRTVAIIFGAFSKTSCIVDMIRGSTHPRLLSIIIGFFIFSYLLFIMPRSKRYISSLLSP